MRGLALAAIFFPLLPFIFIKGPFFGILMWFWLALMSPQEAIWDSVFAQIPYALIVAVATLLWFAVARGEPKIPPRSKTTALFILLMLWITVTSAFAIGPKDQVYDKWLLAEKMLLMTIVAYTLINSRERLLQLIVVCVLSVGFWGFKGGVIAILTGGGTRIYGPEYTMIGDNNDLGVALTTILPLIFYLRQQYRNFAVKWPVSILIGLTILGDIFTYSRGALVALSAMGSILWLRSRNKVLMLILIVVSAVEVWNLAPTAWIDRMMTIETYDEDASAESRLQMWHRAWMLAKMRPIVGGGFHWSYDTSVVNEIFANTDEPKMTIPRAPHSIWFEMLGDHGFVGLALFITILGSAFIDAQWLIRNTRRDPGLAWANNLGRMLQVSLVGYCAGASFATQAMYDGFYAIVIMAAAARHLVAAELGSRNIAPGSVRNFASIAQPAADLAPQSSR
jgi:putative inorganic carbon (hco3(-)) transporter